MRSRCALLVIVVAACGQQPTTLNIERAIPDYAPLAGGATIRIAGTGFHDDEAGANRVLIASREAPLSRTIDDTTLEVVVPPGDEPGDAEVVVLNRHGNARATGILHYSTLPTIESVTPADVVFTSKSTLMTLTGRGLLEEGAGQVDVSVDGQLVTDVMVTSDTSLTFLAPAGMPLVRPDIQVVNSRGSALRQRAFRYTPSVRPGLLLFTVFGPEFAIFYDPTDHSTISIPRADSAWRFNAVVRDEVGDYWGADPDRGGFGPIDMRTQQLASASPQQPRVPAITRIGSDYFALNRNTQRFGKLDPISASFTPIGATIPCCGGYGLSFDGTTLYFAARSAWTQTIRTIDPTTGIQGLPVSVVAPQGFHIEDMRFFQGTLYVANRSGTLVTLDPITGVVTQLPVSPGRFNAMEVFD